MILNAWSGLMPGVGFWDTGEFQTVLPIMGTAHPTGYPTYVLLGFLGNILLTPIGEPALRDHRPVAPRGGDGRRRARSCSSDA